MLATAVLPLAEDDILNLQYPFSPVRAGFSF